MKLRGVKEMGCYVGSLFGVNFPVPLLIVSHKVSIRTSIKISLNSDKTEIIYLDLNANC